MILKRVKLRLTAITIAVSIFLYGCSQIGKGDLKPRNEDTITIDLSNRQIVPLSDLVEDVKYVSFQIDKPLGFGNLLIKDSIIYYHDLQNVVFHVFDFDGNHLNAIDEPGEGPGEFTSIGNFEVNDDGVVVIYDFQLNKKLFYNENLQFVKELPIDLSIPYQQIERLDNGRYLMSTNHNTKTIDGQLTNCEYVLADSMGKPLKKYFDKVYPAENTQSYISYMPFPMQLIKDTKGNIFGNVNYDNSLYAFKDEQFIKYVTVQFENGETINKDRMLQLSKMDQMLYFTRSDDFVGKVSAPNFEIFNEKITLVNYFERAASGVGISFSNFISFSNGEVFHASEIINDLSNFPETITLSYSGLGYYYLNPWYEGSFVKLVYPNEILDSDQLTTLPDGRTISYDDNPVLMIMPIRKDLL
jgi:hypothetical protein